MHPAESAERALASEVYDLQSDRATVPGSIRWFELQAKGCALSMLRGMIAAGEHTNPEAAELYRKRIRVKDLEPEEKVPYG